MTIKYIGLDFEASGTDPWGGNVPIQIGIATPTQDIQYLIGGWDWNKWVWSIAAEEIHGYSQGDLAQELPVWKVDVLCAAAMIPESRSRMFTVMVGWNVAGYDRQFITRWMPNLNKLFSYRTVDLNALVFSLAGDSEKAYIGIKSAAKDYAVEAIEGDHNWHDALYDAKASLAAFKYLTGKISNESN